MSDWENEGTGWLLLYTYVMPADQDPDGDGEAADTMPRPLPDSPESLAELQREFRSRAPAERMLVRLPNPSPALTEALEDGGEGLEALVWAGLDGEQVEVLASDTARDRWIPAALGVLPPPTE